MVSHPSTLSPNPNFITLMTLSSKVLFSLAFHPFYVCSSWNKLIRIHQPSAFFTPDTGCQVVVPREMSDFQPLGDLSNIHFSLPFPPSHPFLFPFSGILNFQQYLQALSLTQPLLADFLEKIESLKYKLFQFLFYFSLGLHNDLLVHFCPFSPSEREQRTLLSGY